MARIYVIDDDEQLLRMVGLMLERGGHAAVLMNDPLKGLQQVKEDKPDLLVLDVMMPDLSGHDLTRQIRNTPELEDLPILILTARSQEIDRMTALKSGADDYLSKPVTSQELIERVDGLLAQKTEKATSSDLGIIIAFYGFRGGVGKTTLTVNLATALRRLSHQEVCVVDFSPSGGQIEKQLRLQIQSTWADLPDAGELDWPALQERLTIHPSGLRVLAAPAQLQSPLTPAAEVTAKILEILGKNVMFTIVDLPPILSPSCKEALSMSSMALQVITPEMITVQTAVQTNRSLPKFGVTLNYKSHILNQTAPDAQLKQAAIERMLNTRIAFQIGYDSNQIRALTQGVPLTLTPAKSPLPTVTMRMAEVIWERVKKNKE